MKNDQLDPQRKMQNGHPVRVVKVIPGSELEKLLEKMRKEKPLPKLNCVATQGCQVNFQQNQK